jgi:hypothetical protein
MPVSISGTNGINNATWTTATRPSSPTTGQMGYNTTIGAMEFYNGSAWVQGGGLSSQAVQTTGFTAIAGNIYPCNTTSAAFTVILPASPATGNQITLIDYAGTYDTNNLTINPNGGKINGVAANAFLSSKRESVTLIYLDSTQGWMALSSASVGTSPLPQTYTATYLIVAGGGSGGSNYGGPGGAGGYLTGTTLLTAGTVYTATIGAGGSGNSGNQGISGNNSSFTSLTTAIGGGGGGGGGSSALSGGSGGGGGGNTNGTPGSGTSGQGNAGGSGATTNQSSGGGGGAGAVGGNGSGGTGGTGGVGLSNSITGSAVFYAGGGGGVGNSGSRPGGTGGGGNGGQPGTANTGGGGGGDSGAGGSGVIIISVPTANYTGTTTGSPTVTTNGSNTVIKFNSSGTYTA